MLRRFVSHFPLKTLSAKSVYPFSNEKEVGNKWVKKYRSFTSQTQLQKLMLQQIDSLSKRILGKEQEKQTAQNSYFSKDQTAKDNRHRQAESDEYSKKKLKRFIIYVILLTGLNFMQGSSTDEQQQFSRKNGAKRIISESQMLNLLSSGNYNSELIISREMIYSQTGKKKIYQTICLAKEANKAEVPIICVVNNLSIFLSKLETINFPYKVNFNYSTEEPISISISPKVIDFVLSAGLAAIIYRIFSKRGSLRGFMGGGGRGLSEMLNMKKFEPIKPENIQTVFKDVAGMHQAKTQITQFVDFLKNSDKYIDMGAKVPKGALLTGPPGTGKTLLARACAGQAGVPFFYVSGSEFVQKYVGLGANRVRNLFEQAAKAAPSIIFIDEIDAIGKKRNSGPFSNEEKQNTLNQLLVNMDGFDSKNKIIVMAATNLKDSLDPALLRPGRFDRSIEISLPNFEERVEILKVHLEKVKFAQKFTIQEMAKKISVLTPGFSGAELANICNQAAILAARANKEVIELPQFQKATERVMAGLEKRNLFSDSEKECLAYYECGKAVVSWFTKGADPIIKISIAPYSKQSKGYSHQIKDEMPLKTQEELVNKAICLLAGRTAESYFKGYTTSNGDNDLKKVKRILTFMVAKLGMSPVIGRIGFPDTQYMRKPYSENTQGKIDEEINRLLLECQQNAKKLVLQKQQMIQKLKVMILEKETLTHNTLKQVLGERPFDDNQNYQKFLKDTQKSQKEEETIIPPSPQ